MSDVLVLASASPRRRAILERLGVPFRVHVSGVDERAGAARPPSDFVLWAATAKALDVTARSWASPPPVVLGADTVVVVDDTALGKPEDDAHAERMLSSLAGRWHRVTTAVVLARPGEGVLGFAVVTSHVRFRALSTEEIARYVASGEGVDKAGGYAIQGGGRELVDRLRGSFTNVVGLPATHTLQLLARHRAVEGWP